jgi:GNAT superfamily N-acetyltransferase
MSSTHSTTRAQCGSESRQSHERGHAHHPARQRERSERPARADARLLRLLQGLPSDEDLLALARALLGDHDREGVQLLARDVEGRAVAFATVYWSWSTTSACRIGVMNDLFVAQDARGQGLAEALIGACRTACTQHGARELTWQTAPDNLRAQAVYERVGATAKHWVDYSMPS